MKRQADDVSCLPKEGGEQATTNGNKRLKLLNSEGNGESSEVNREENSTVNMSESSFSHNHKDHLPSIIKPNSCTGDIDDAVETNTSENHSPLNLNENGNCTENSISSCNEAVVKVSANDSGIASELYHSNSHGNPITYSEENEENGGLEPPVLNHCDHDIQNSDSTDSLHSEGFDADNCAHETEVKEISKEYNGEEVNDDAEKEYFVDVDNIMMCQLKVTELEGHTDVVFSIAADEDYILSASADTTVRVWSTEDKTPISTFSGHSDSITSILLLSPNQSKSLKKKMSFSKVSRIAITGSLDCHIKFWSVLEGKELASVYTYNGITCLGYLESECLVVVGTEGGKLELWDMASSSVKRSERAHEDAVTDIKIKDNYIYSVSLDGTVKVWVYEDDDIYPLYTRKRKEITSDKVGFKPAQWKTVAVSEDMLYLGDSTNNIKVLNWKAGNLRLFKNQMEEKAVCECVVIENNILFSTHYDSSSDTGGVNIWKLPEMTYVCSLTNVIARSLAVVQKGDKLYIICGGPKLCIWEIDFSELPNSSAEDGCLWFHKLETLGFEIDEKPVEIKKVATSIPAENISNNRWCNIM